MSGFVASMLTSTWRDLKIKIEEEFRKEGRDPTEMQFRPSLKLQYFGMLKDLEVESPSEELTAEFSKELDRFDSPELREILRRYDELFELIFRRGTKSPELGYQNYRSMAYLAKNQKIMPQKGQEKSFGIVNGMRLQFGR